METTKKERLRNRTRTLIERSIKVYPWKREGRVYLDSCDDFRYKGEDILIIYVDDKGATYESMDFKKPGEHFMDWDQVLELSEDNLETMYNNSVGTIRNEG